MQPSAAPLSLPRLSFPADLPISEHRDEIAAAIRDNQVIVLAGETGSGKTTQLPKICLQVGRGQAGMIGHTQPRRIAARTVAERIASELGEPLGGTVGYTVRFHDQVSPSTQIKLMTDGILLAEIQRDRMLRAYDTIIIDEAHERSLTIDFLLGYLKSLLPRRPDLKVIITSATIDPQRFAAHFPGPDGAPAPVLEVSGRTYPVEVRYRPLDLGAATARDGRRDAEAGAAKPTPAAAAAASEPRDQNTAICDAVRELWRAIDGDILVFLSGEREIRDAAAAVEAIDVPGLDVLPLYGRLSAAEQHRVFAAHDARRVVLATNVAETSLTVPGVRAVIDVGTARISRYSTRTKVQRLPIEPISQASANQRSGRCGRVAPGICIRLYSEADYASRPEFTEPEILRTNLASVVLQMAALGLGQIARFPFLDPPDQRNVRDAVRLLDEIGALHADGRAALTSDSARVRLTEIGRSLARLPVDPRLGRMLLAAGDEGCVTELLVIASALSIQDPRERPSDQPDAAALAHRRFDDPSSDFVSYLNLWGYLREQQAALSSSAFRRLCRAEFLNFLRIREWQDLHAQLLRVARDLGLKRNGDPAAPANVHRAVLAGLLSHIGLLDEQAPERPGRDRRRGDRPPSRPRRQRPDYRGARSTKFTVVRDSALAAHPPVWVMAGELVETNRLWGRIAARIEPEWAEPLAAHLVTRIYSEPRWDARRGSATATERVTLYGLPLVAGRRVNYATIDPEAAREIFIRHALVEGDWPSKHPVLLRTREAIERAQEISRRARRPVEAVDEDALFAFFDATVPADVVSGRHFETWWKAASREDPGLLELPAALLNGEAKVDPEAYPDEWHSDGLRLPLTYRFSPGDALDGVTVDVPVTVLNRLPADPAATPVAAQRDELVVALLRALPKAQRRALTPIADTAAAVIKGLDAAAEDEAGTDRADGEGAEGRPPGTGLLERLSQLVLDLRGVRVPSTQWPLDSVPAHLRATYRILDDAGRELARGKDLAALRERLAPAARQALADAAPDIERATLRSWDFGALPRTVDRIVGGNPIVGYPALVDEGASAAVRILASRAEQEAAMPAGTRRLLAASVPSPARAVAAALDNRTKLVLAGNPHGSVPALLADCADAAIDQIVAAAGGPAWDGPAFALLVQAVRAELPDRATAAARAVAPVLDLWRQVVAELPPAPAAPISAGVADIRGQLAGLIRTGFVAASGVERMADFARYLMAAQRRLEKMPRDPDADHERQLRIEHVQAAYDEVLAALRSDLPAPGNVAAIRWMIEELRVSLFAQELGTRGRVSETRIYRAIDDAAGG